MTHIENIRRLIEEHNGIVTSAMLTKMGIPRLYLKKMTDSGELKSVCRGIYVESDAWEDEMYILQCKYSKGILSHGTALYIHGITDRTPSKYTMTFNYGYHSSSLKSKNVCDKYAVESVYNLGIMQAKSPCGNDINVYNIEKTLCDIVKGNNIYDIQVVNKIQNYMEILL